jgi:precorrin-6A synthase
MRTLLVVGVGPGDPEQVTVAAVRALNRLDVIFVLDKGGEKRALVEAREEICRRHIEGPYRIVELADPERDRGSGAYREAVSDWHGRRAEVLERALLAEVGADETAGLLVWGDPSLYDSTIRVVERILARGAVAFDWEVFPGVTSVQVLTARHRITLTGVGEPVLLTTGRRFAADPVLGDGATVVMLDGGLACHDLDDSDAEIFWGANLGSPGEELRSGRLADVVDEIAETRAELRAAAGWVMDTYLLRKRDRGQ